MAGLIGESGNIGHVWRQIVKDCLGLGGSEFALAYVAFLAIPLNHGSTIQLLRVGLYSIAVSQRE
jgi:hypothetical protein